MRRRLTGLVLALAVVLAGCGDAGPEGPGTLDVRVRGAQPAGAVVLEVRGTGITGVTPRGSVQAFHETVATASDGEETHRVILVAEAPGDMEFGLRVDDVGAPRPRVVVVAASDAQDRAIPSVAGFSVDVTR